MAIAACCSAGVEWTVRCRVPKISNARPAEVRPNPSSRDAASDRCYAVLYRVTLYSTRFCFWHAWSGCFNQETWQIAESLHGWPLKARSHRRKSERRRGSFLRVLFCTATRLHRRAVQAAEDRLCLCRGAFFQKSWPCASCHGDASTSLVYVSLSFLFLSPHICMHAHRHRGGNSSRRSIDLGCFKLFRNYVRATFVLMQAFVRDSREHARRAILQS